MAKRSSSIESFDEYHMVVVDDLSAWEFINVDVSDDDVEDLGNFSLSDNSSVSVENLLDDVVSRSKEEDPEFGSPSSDFTMQSLLVELQPPNLDDMFGDQDGVGAGAGAGAGAVRDDECENYDEEDKYDDEYDYDDYDDGYYLDDELVPLEVSDKFGRQRIRKLGKRACPRMNKSKRLPYKYNRPGCVHGKHGLGVQHAYI